MDAIRNNLCHKSGSIIFNSPKFETLLAEDPVTIKLFSKRH